MKVRWLVWVMRALIVENGKTRGALPAARALAAARIEVGLACPDRSGLAYWSKATTAWYPVPAVEGGMESFLDGVAAAVKRHGSEIVFPSGDAEALALAYGRHRIGTVVPLPEYSKVHRAFDKLDLTESAARGGLRAPRTLVASEENLAQFEGQPVVVKSRLHWSPVLAGSKSRLEAEICTTPQAAREVARRFIDQGGEPVLQEVVPRGCPLHVHSVADRDSNLITYVASYGPDYFYPPGAGRRTRGTVVTIPAELERAVAATLREMGWIGFGSFCFLLDAKGRPFFVDFNGRIPMSLDVTVVAGGINVMELWGDVALGLPLPPIPESHIGARHQWLSGDARRAFVERRGGLVADLVDTLRFAVGARHTLLVAGDLRPLVRHSMAVVLRELRAHGPGRTRRASSSGKPADRPAPAAIDSDGKAPRKTAQHARAESRPH